MKHASHSKGFSLVELMIVVVVIGILAAVAVPAYFNHIMRSRQSDAYHNLLDIKAAQEMYYSMVNDYAGDYEPLHTFDNTFTRLLSFDFTDTKYYRYYVISSTNPDIFTATAEGRFKKLIGDSIRITESDDPCMSFRGALESSLGLDDCP
ncbi:MAG: prepilin-type N-terminal cleavage/methylation domain-containing protein [Deltaproteobacteria bacterium]|jgi:type IV pilus assembly protein PilE|nr:prepilin-type N-terminal cleavage/methylation domain-containing protein [Deltaproteobacteria bacterium]